MARSRVVELVMAVRVSQACNSPLREEVLNALARKLAAAGRYATLAKQQQALASLHSSTLAQLLRRTLRCVGAAERRPPGKVSRKPADSRCSAGMHWLATQSGLPQS